MQKETQTWLNCHYKFISAKNIIILSVSSDDFTRLIWGWKTANMNYSLYMSMDKKKRENPIYIIILKRK